tara:strand:+ start:1041 stop:1628 length:588 start_codon:yes stop_codon:yes gene_type:complete
MPLWLLTAPSGLHLAAAPALQQAAAPARQQASPAMLLRDQTGGGNADGFRFDAYGGMGQEGGRYEALPRYGKGCDAGPKTWQERGGWSETRGGAAAGGVALPAAKQHAAMPAAMTPEEEAKATWLARQGPGLTQGKILSTKNIAGSDATRDSSPLAGVVKPTGRYSPPDEAEFRYGPGSTVGQYSPEAAWHTGGP